MSITGDDEDIQKLCKLLTGQADCYNALDTGKLKKVVRLIRSGISVSDIAEQVGLEVSSVRVIIAVLKDESRFSSYQ